MLFFWGGGGGWWGGGLGSRWCYVGDVGVLDVACRV